MKKITSMCLSLLVVQSALALDLTTIKQQNNKSVVTSMDASFNTSISTLSYRDATGSSLHSIDLDLSMFTQDCLANSDTAGACTLDDELIWEAFSYQTLLPFLPVAASDNQIDANAIESCRSEIGVVMNATWQMCIPKLHVAGDDQDYWAILDLDRSIEGRVFFRLQAHGLVTEATWIDNATDGTVDAGQTYVTGVNYITSHWQFLDHSIAREVRQQEHIIYLDITNTANVDLLIKPKILFDLGNVQRLGKYLPQQRILAKDDSLVEIDLDSFGYSFEQMLYSGAIALVLEVSDANSGVFLENITPEIIYWHQDNISDELVLYDTETLHNVYHSGDFLGNEVDEDLYEPAVLTERIISGDSIRGIENDEALNFIPDAKEMADTEFNDGVEVNVKEESSLKIGKSYTVKTCAKWDVNTIDSGIKISSGFPSANITEDYWQNCNGGCLAKARGVKMKLNYGLKVKYAYANPETGCHTWKVSNTFASSYKLSVYTKTKDVHGNYIRLHDKPYSHSKYPGRITKVVFNHALGNHTFNVNVGNFNDPKWTIVAAASFGIYRYNDGVYGKLINIAPDYSTCVNSTTYSGLFKSRQHIKIGSRMSPCANNAEIMQGRMKLGITHELGHAMATLYYGSQPGAVGGLMPNLDANLDVTNEIASCNFSTEGYSFDSKEWNSVGYSEGFANFIAAKIWNNKNQLGALNLFTAKHDLEAFDKANTPGGRLVNKCVGSLTGKSTNGDWTRFLWDFYTNSSSICNAQPSKLDMLQLYSKTRLLVPSKGGFYNAMRSIVDEIGLPSCLAGARFDFYAAHNGINL